MPIASRVFAIAVPRLFLGHVLLHLLQRVVQHQGEVVEAGHDVLLVAGDLVGFSVPEAAQREFHVVVDEANFSVDCGCQLRDAQAQLKQRVFYHARVVLEPALGLSVEYVCRVVVARGSQRLHQPLLVKRQVDDVFEQRAQSVHIDLQGLLTLLLHHAFHLLRHLLHFIRRFLLLLGGFFVFFLL